MWMYVCVYMHMHVRCRYCWWYSTDLWLRCERAHDKCNCYDMIIFAGTNKDEGSVFILAVPFIMKGALV